MNKKTANPITLRQRDKLKRLTGIYVLADLIAIASVLLILFLPMYKADYPVGEYVVDLISGSSLDGVEIIDLEAGEITKTFSLSEDFIKSVKYMCRDTGTDGSSFANFFANLGDNASVFFLELLPFVLLFLLLMLLALTAMSDLLNIIVTFLTPGDRLSEFGNSVGDFVKDNEAKPWKYYLGIPVLCVIFMIFDIAWLKLGALIFDGASVRHMANIRSLTMYAVIPALVALAYFLVTKKQISDSRALFEVESEKSIADAEDRA